METIKIIERIKNIIIKPHEEWQLIKNEEISNNHIVLTYLLPLITINLVATIIGSSFFSFKSSFYANTITYTIFSAILGLLVLLIALYTMPYIIKALAPSFGFQTEYSSAFKWLAYSMTPNLVVGIVVGLLPVLYMLGILGLYSFYVLWVGMDKLFEIQKDKKIGFYIVSVLILLAEYLIGWILGFILFQSML